MYIEGLTNAHEAIRALEQSVLTRHINHNRSVAQLLASNRMMCDAIIAPTVVVHNMMRATEALERFVK